MWVIQTDAGVAGPAIWLWTMTGRAPRLWEFDRNAAVPIADRLGIPTSVHPLMRATVFVNPNVVPIEESQDLVFAISVNMDDESAWAIADDLLIIANGGSADLGEFQVVREGQTFSPAAPLPDPQLKFNDEDGNWFGVTHGCFETDPISDLWPTDMIWAVSVLITVTSSLTGDEEIVPISIGQADGLLFRVEANDDDEFFFALATTDKAAVAVYNDTYAFGPIEEAVAALAAFDFE